MLDISQDFADTETSSQKPEVTAVDDRALLDAAPWDEDERAGVVDEVKRAYELNIAMFHDLWRTTEAAAA